MIKKHDKKRRSLNFFKLRACKGLLYKSNMKVLSSNRHTVFQAFPIALTGGTRKWPLFNG